MPLNKKVKKDQKLKSRGGPALIAETKFPTALPKDFIDQAVQWQQVTLSDGRHPLRSMLRKCFSFLC